MPGDTGVTQKPVELIDLFLCVELSEIYLEIKRWICL